MDVIVDEAQQKGTGKWTVQDAMDLRVPVPAIGSAVHMRDLSDLRKERQEAAHALSGPDGRLNQDGAQFVDRLARAMRASMVIVYSQGMAQLAEASRLYGYGLKLEEVARIWRGGCIVRSGLLEPYAVLSITGRPSEPAPRPSLAGNGGKRPDGPAGRRMRRGRIRHTDPLHGGLSRLF